MAPLPNDPQGVPGNLGPSIGGQIDVGQIQTPATSSATSTGSRGSGGFISVMIVRSMVLR